MNTSGYYRWRKSPKLEPPDILGIKVIRVFKDSNGIYGVRRIQKALLDEGNKASKYSIRKRMSNYGLVAKATKKYKATTNSKHNLPVHPNLLEQNFNVSTPNQVWVSDFTYLWTTEGWQYLAVVIDLYSRRIVGWNISNRMTKELVINALKMAIRQRKPGAGLIIHSDRGSQYCSKDYQKLIKQYKMCCSMSKKGDCYDNACAETFFHSLKVEWIFGKSYKTRKQCLNDIRYYIEIFFNRRRLHSYLGYRSPDAYEKAA